MRYDGDEVVDIETARRSVPCVTEIMPKMTVDGGKGRPTLHRDDLVIPGHVTRHEQDMIDLTSTFTETFTTEVGRRFVEKKSRMTNGADFRIDDFNSHLIMWPTHPPHELESFDGDFGSDVNWIFALCDPVKSTEKGLTPNGRVIRVVITGSLYPIQDSLKHTKVFSSVLIEEPSRYLKPNGELLHAAMATIEAMHAENRAKYYRWWKIYERSIKFWSLWLLYIGCLLLFFSSHPKAKISSG